MTEIITSRSNRIITEAAKLRDKKYRDIQQAYCFEGRKLFEEAVSSDVEFDSIFVTEKYRKSHSLPLDIIAAPIYTVTDSVYEKLTLDRAPDGIFCIAKKKHRNGTKLGRIFILSSVRDPGNLGTCIRSARAFGIDTLILHDCADAYNPKVIRASMGAFFRQELLIAEDIIALIGNLNNDGYRVLPTALTNKSIPLDTLNLDGKTAFIIGNEGHGISDEVIHACGDTSVIIPMVGDTESLNASTAASLLMWELSKTH